MNSLINRLTYLYEQFPTLEGDRGQIGLVKASGASKSVVNQWLSGGIKSIDIKYALEIERTLGVSHIWLMTGTGDFTVSGEGQTLPPKGERDRLTLATPEELDILDLFRLSDEMGRSAIIKAAKRARKRLVDDVLRDQK